MRLAEMHVSPRVPLLLLGLWALLGPVRGSHGRPSWHYASAEVVIPRRHTHYSKGFRVPGWLSYSLRFGGQRHIIHLWRKTPPGSRHQLVVTQNDQGALQMEYPYFPQDCSYIGYVEEVPLSMASISTCYGGLEGIMKLDDLAYEITPLKDSLIFEHIVSQIVVDVNGTVPQYRLGEKEEMHPRLQEANVTADPRISSKVYPFHPGTVKALIQSSNELYKAQGSNVTTCVTYMMRLGRLVQAMMENISLRYIVIALTVYDKADPVPLNNFKVPDGPYYQLYKRVFLPAIKPNSAFLVFQKGPYELDVVPERYSICKENNLIYLGLRDRHYFLGAIIGAQQVARAFGLEYDGPNCVCQRRATCIMSKYPVVTDSFSNCSFVDLAHIATSNLATCLFEEKFTYFNETITLFYCGNKIVDQGEQCDCGSFKQCYANPCCESVCKFTPGSLCDGQDCCTNCTYSPRGTLCRSIQNICDLPEYCHGNSFRCPENLYLQDGTPCTEEGYCFHGNCSDRTMHCREIFGRNARNADEVCYKINTKGNRFGHCSRSYQSLGHQRCLAEDVLCGRLQCANVTHLPQLQEHVSFHQSKWGSSWCFGLDEHRSTGVIDDGYVREGTLCAPGRYCQKTHCKGSVRKVNYDCKPEKCSFRGLCNNKKKCHCHIGWEPPLCKRRGAGGSEDSGPPPRKVRTIAPSLEPMNYLRVVFGRVYSFIAALLFGVATNVRTIKTVTVQ